MHVRNGIGEQIILVAIYMRRKKYFGSPAYIDGVIYFLHEDPTYREEINVREYPTGNLIEKIPGTLITMPGEQNWILR